MFRGPYLAGGAVAGGAFSTPESLRDFIDLVVPILQERGVYKRDYRPGTLRDKLFGHARLPATHPAAAHRRPPPGAK
jgi:hypothetical protein